MSAVQKWGNSLAIRIPASLAGQLQLGEGTPVELAVRDDELVVRPKTRPKYSLKLMLKNCKPGQLHGELDFGPDVGREIVE
jgi:antitoxin MazE